MKRTTKIVLLAVTGVLTLGITIGCYFGGKALHNYRLSVKAAKEQAPEAAAENK